MSFQELKHFRDLNRLMSEQETTLLARKWGTSLGSRGAARRPAGPEPPLAAADGSAGRAGPAELPGAHGGLQRAPRQAAEPSGAERHLRGGRGATLRRAWPAVGEALSRRRAVFSGT